MKLEPGEPCAVERECQPTIIPISKYRRLQNISRFVVETFDTGLKKVLVRIDCQGNWPNHAWNAAGRAKHQRPVLHSRWCRRGIIVNKEIRGEEGEYEGSQMNMTAIRAQGKGREPSSAGHR